MPIEASAILGSLSGIGAIAWARRPRRRRQPAGSPAPRQVQAPRTTAAGQPLQPESGALIDAVGHHIELGPWSWWVVGLVLFAAEMLVPGFFLVWIGLAAAAVGALSLPFWDSAVWVWQLQAILFAASPSPPPSSAAS